MKTKKYVLLCITIVLAVSVLIMNLSLTTATEQLSFSHSENGVVDKAQNQAFNIKINFKNTGTSDGNWSVNVVFEGDSWSWTGTAKNLTLQAGETKVLAWNGTVPANAKIDSVARLVVYYNDSVKALNWWIHVVPGSELTITSSTVE